MTTIDSAFKTIWNARFQIDSVCDEMVRLCDANVYRYSPLTNATYCIDEQTECNIYEMYDAFGEWMNARGITACYDIGCSCGFQGELFKLRNLKYIGIDIPCTPDYHYRNAWNEYVFRKYPFDINPVSNSIAVSDFCIGYFGDDENKARQLAKEFETALIGYTNEKTLYDVYSKYFDITPVKGLHQMEFFVLTRRRE